MIIFYPFSQERDQNHQGEAVGTLKFLQRLTIPL